MTRILNFAVIIQSLLRIFKLVDHCLLYSVGLYILTSPLSFIHLINLGRSALPKSGRKPDSLSLTIFCLAFVNVKENLAMTWLPYSFKFLDLNLNSSFNSYPLKSYEDRDTTHWLSKDSETQSTSFNLFFLGHLKMCQTRAYKIPYKSSLILFCLTWIYC